MVIVSAVLSIVLGMFFGVVLILTEKGGLSPHKTIHFILEKITDVICSFPTMILIVALTPLTRLVIGTKIGAVALTYGYQRFDYAIMYFIVAILIVFVLLIQELAKAIYNKLK